MGMAKIFKLLMVILMGGLAGCARSQTTRETSVYCKGDYLYALDYGAWPIQTEKSSSEESYLTYHLNEKLNALLRMKKYGLEAGKDWTWEDFSP